MSGEIRVIVCRVGRRPVVEALAPDARNGGHGDAMRAIVGGDFQCLYLADSGGIDLWCNEDGQGLELPVNRIIPARAAEVPEGWWYFKCDPKLCDPGEMGVHIIHGDFFFARVNDEGEMADVNDDDVKLWTERFDSEDDAAVIAKFGTVQPVDDRTTDGRQRREIIDAKEDSADAKETT